MYCKSCGSTIPDDTKYCPACGAGNETQSSMPEMPKIPVIEAVPGASESAGASYTPPPPPPSQYTQMPPPPNPNPPPVPNPQPMPYGQPYAYAPYTQSYPSAAPDENTAPMSTGSFLLNLFLFSIPFIGFVLQLVYAFSQGNINRRNLARAYLLFQIIAVALSIFIVILIGLFAAPYMNDIVNSMDYYYS